MRCTGEAVIRNITAEEAHRLALENARQDAVEKACGYSLQSESLVRNFSMAGDFVHAISHGRVVEEKDLKWETAALPADRPGRPPSPVIRVSMSARVVSETGSSDPGFTVSVEINKRDFRSGEDAVFVVKASRDCHVTVFNLAANDSVYVLFPNPVQSENFLRAGDRLRIPSDGYHIKVKTLPGHDKDSETVQVIATKRDITLFDESDEAFGSGVIGTPKVAVTRLARALAAIPVAERAEDAEIYTVTAE